MSKLFQIIVADCPWTHADQLTMSNTPRGAAANYHVMSNDDIKGLPVNEYADPDGCLLALWVPAPLLQIGMDTMKEWKFDQKQVYVWVKVKKDPFKTIVSRFMSEFDGNLKSLNTKQWREYFTEVLNDFSLQDILSFYMGRLFRNMHEICLIGINNNAIYKKLENKSQRAICFDVNTEHSAKPEHLQQSLELMFPQAEKLELFARRQRTGWICIGDEMPDTLGEDIRDSLKKLV